MLGGVPRCVAIERGPNVLVGNRGGIGQRLGRDLNVADLAVLGRGVLVLVLLEPGGEGVLIDVRPLRQRRFVDADDRKIAGLGVERRHRARERGGRLETACDRRQKLLAPSHVRAPFQIFGLCEAGIPEDPLHPRAVVAAVDPLKGRVFADQRRELVGRDAEIEQARLLVQDGAGRQLLSHRRLDAEGACLVGRQATADLTAELEKLTLEREPILVNAHLGLACRDYDFGVPLDERARHAPHREAENE